MEAGKKSVLLTYKILILNHLLFSEEERYYFCQLKKYKLNHLQNVKQKLDSKNAIVEKN